MTFSEERKPAQQLERAYYDARLHEMLRWKRPHNSGTERWWVNKFIVEPYKAWPLTDPVNDKEVWAWVVTVERPEGGLPKVMFSSHTDTVHQREGKQRLVYNIATSEYHKNDGEPLGADDGAGVWLMLEMIDRKVPGVYVFHRGEERGGIGSSGIADEYGTFLEVFDAAIAFDRKATYSVITWQGMGRCASDEFALALAEGLNNANDDFMYDADDSGIFTDTANYTDIIPECSNVSVGYYDEHTPRERLHLPHLFALRDALTKVNWEALPIKRDPSKPETWGSQYDRNWDVAFTQDESWREYTKSSRVSTLTHGTRKVTRDDLDSYRLANMTRSEMENLAYDDTELFIDLVRYELNGDIPKWVREDDEFNFYRGEG